MNEPYKPFTDGPDHPTAVRHTQTSKLASPDPITDEEMQTLLAPKLRDGKLSAVQLDAVVLARKAHNAGKAFIVGDATGLGKGRTGVGSLYNGFLLDHPETIGRRAVYFSTAKVFETLVRDVRDMCVKASIIDVRNERDRTIPKGMDSILFVSYYSLSGKPKDGKESAAKFIERYIRGAPNAGKVPMIIDESHTVKNCYGNGASASGIAAFQLFHDTRDLTTMTFMSATAASRMEHLRLYAPFVGFVGDGSSGGAAGAFISFDRLNQKLGNNKDASALEFLSAELIRTGCMCSRALGYDGITFSEETVNMPAEWRAMHDAATVVFDRLYDTNLFTGPGRLPHYYSEALRFFKCLSLSGKVASTIEVAKDRLSKGMNVVISMMSTGEAAAGRAVAAAAAAVDAEDEEVVTVADAGVRETLLGLITKAEEYHEQDTKEGFTALAYMADVRSLIVEGSEDADDWVGEYVFLSGMNDKESMWCCFEGAVGLVRTALDDETLQVDLLRGVARNQGIGEEFLTGEACIDLKLDEVKRLSALPDNKALRRTMGFDLLCLRREAVCLNLPSIAPLDELKDALGGSDHVAELTGRKKFLERDATSDGWKPVTRRRKVELDIADFQAVPPRKKAAVLSLASSTGISLHADGEGAGRRCMIMFELPWSAEQAMQQIGRVHRAGQESAPEYVLMCSDRGFDTRFSATVAARLASLGAIASGDRETVTTSQKLRLRGTADLDADQFVSPRAHDAVLSLYSEADYRPYFDQMRIDIQHVTGRKFMNRALALPCADSDKVFDAFVDAVHEAISKAEQQGTASKPIEMITVDDDRVKLLKTMVSPTLNAEINVFRIDKGMTFDDAKAKRDEIMALGWDASKVFFGYMATQPCLVWHRTRRTFDRYDAVGRISKNLHIDQKPFEAVVDQTFESHWNNYFRKFDSEEPRVTCKRILMLPSLSTLALLGGTKATCLAKITLLDGRRTLGVDLGSEITSIVSNSMLAKQDFATREEHEQRRIQGGGPSSSGATSIVTAPVAAGGPRPRRQMPVFDTSLQETGLYEDPLSPTGYAGVTEIAPGVFEARHAPTCRKLGTHSSKKKAAAVYAKYVNGPGLRRATPAHMRGQRPGSVQSPAEIALTRFNFLLEKVLQHDQLSIREFDPFRKPSQNVLPGYNDVIRAAGGEPMDLSTMSAKAKQKQYRTVMEFHADAARIKLNCYYYHTKRGVNLELQPAAERLEKMIQSSPVASRPELEQLEHKIATLAAPAAPSSNVEVSETGLPPMGGPTSESESDESVMPYDEAGMRRVAARIARDVNAQLDAEMVDAAPSGADEPQPMSVDDELEELEKKEAEIAAKRQALLEKKKVAQECAGVFRRNP
jgi:hypothetical protein